MYRKKTRLKRLSFLKVCVIMIFKTKNNSEKIWTWQACIARARFYRLLFYLNPPDASQAFCRVLYKSVQNCGVANMKLPTTPTHWKFFLNMYQGKVCTPKDSHSRTNAHIWYKIRVLWLKFSYYNFDAMTLEFWL